MIRSVVHPLTHALHRAHHARHRRAWVIVLTILGAVATLWFSGYLGTIDWPKLLDAIVQTTYRLALAYAIALFFGVGIALLVGWSPFSDVLFPFFDVLQNIPSFSLIPLFIYFFGLTTKMVVFFAVSSIIWPILFAVLTAIKSAHTDLNDAATIFGATGLKRIPFYLVPLSFPAIVTGSIVGIAIGWEAVIGAEIITHLAGFGGFIEEASASGVSQSMVIGTFAILVIVFIINRIVWAPLLSQSSRHYVE